MTVAIDIVLILHFIGLAAIIGSWMTVLKEPRVIPGMLHGAILQVVTGLALVALNEIDDQTLNHTKIAVKLVVAVLILVLAVLGLRKAAVVAPGSDASATATVTSTATLAHAIGLLGILDVVIAVLW